MLSIFIFFTLYLFYCFKSTTFIPYEFTLNKVNILKAVLPFIIIIHHLSFEVPQTIISDFHFTGPYVVGLFFFMSGYGLEYQYNHHKVQIRRLPYRLKKIFVPFILPTLFYIVLVYSFYNKPFHYLATGGFIDAQLLLPYTWFITVLVGMYICYYFTRNLFRNNNYFLLFMFAVFTLFIIGIYNSHNSHLYTSNYAFIVGIAMKQNEKKWLEIASYKKIYALSFIVLGLISVSYIEQKPLFKGFGVIGVPFYVVAFITLFTRITALKENKLIKFFSSISYEMYLFQGVTILIITKIGIENIYLLITSVLCLNILLSFIAYKITSSALSLWNKK
jgi:hypothetical protein